MTKNQNYFIRFGGDPILNTNYNTKSITIPIAGTFKNFYASRGTGSDTITFTLYKNGGAQTITCQTSSSSTCHDTAHSISVAVNDTAAIGVSNGAGGSNDGDFRFTIEFDPS